MEETFLKAQNELKDKLYEKIEELSNINKELKLEIAELRQTEKTLKESQTRFKLVQKMGMVGNWEWDLVHNKTIWSDELYHIFGVKPEQFNPDAYEAFLNCIYVDDRSFVEGTIEKSINEKSTFDIKYRIVQPDGTIRDIHALGEVICDEKGNPVKMLGTSHDITELKQTEVRLRRSENIGKIGNWEYDIPSNRIIWSDQVYELFGRDPESGPPTVDEEQKYYSEEVKNRLIQYTQQVLKTGEPVKDYEFPVNNENGNTSFFIGSMFPGKDKNGRIIKLFGTFQDITERKQAQQEIIRHLEFERYISGLASGFINLSTDETDTEITRALHWMADYFEVDRVTLLKLSDDKRELQTVDFYASDAIKPVIVINLPTLLQAIWPKLQIGEPFSWSVVDESADEATADMKILEQLSAKSVVIIPIMVGDNPEYVFTIASLKKLQAWDRHLIPRIQLLGKLFVSVLYRKKEKEILKRKEQSLADAQHLADLGDWQLNIGNDEVIWSDELYNILGYRQSEIKASREAFLDRVHPDDRPILEKYIFALRSDNKPFAIDHRIVLPDGIIKYCHSMGSLRYDEEKKSVFLNGIVQDITERKLAEATLRKSESNLASAQRIAHLGSWEWNIPTNELTWSDEVYRIFGLTKNHFNVTLDSFRERIHPEDLKSLNEALNRVLTNPENGLSIQHRIIRLDGTERIVQEQGEVRTDTEGKPILLLGTVHDLTELKSIEAETKQLRNELSHLNRVNTIGNMAAAIAHEINQPLAAILSNSQAALRLLNIDPPDINEVREALTDIVWADKRASDVIRRIRALVKKEEIRNESYNINNAIREVVNLVQNEILIKNTSLQMKLDPHIPVLFGDNIQIQQVVLNLVMNALEAVNSRSVNDRHIVINTGINENHLIWVSVTDSGPGLDEDNIDNLFDAFYTTKDKGMGMGLSVCESIIRNHGGYIKAENCPDGGAKFLFELPVRKREK